MLQNKKNFDLVFAQFSDVHSPRDRGALEHFVKQINENSSLIDFVISTGDALDEAYCAPTEQRANELYSEFAETLKRLNVPVYHVIGDHDMPISVNQSRLKCYKGIFKKFFGDTQYIFERKGINFIILDPFPENPEDMERLDRRLFNIDWLRQQLKKTGTESPIIIVSHKDFGDTFNYKDFLKAVNGYNILAAICGDAHGNSVIERDNLNIIHTATLCGRVTISFASHENSPAGYRLFCIKNGRLDHAYVALNNPHHVDLSEPLRRTVYNGLINITGRVIDLTDEVTNVYCRIGDQFYASEIQSYNGLWKNFKLCIDSSQFRDGFHNLEITPSSPYEIWPYGTMIIIDNNRTFETEKDAELVMTVQSLDEKCNVKDNFEISCNNHYIATINNISRPKELKFRIPKKFLKHITTITVKAEYGSEKTTYYSESIGVRNVFIEHNSRKHSDATMHPIAEARLGSWIYAESSSNFYFTLD